MTDLIGRHLDMYAELMTEAAVLIEAIPPAIFDTIKARHPLCDELCGAAAMAKDDATALRQMEIADCGNTPYDEGPFTLGPLPFNAEITGLSG